MTSSCLKFSCLSQLGGDDDSFCAVLQMNRSCLWELSGDQSKLASKSNQVHHQLLDNVVRDNLINNVVSNDFMLMIVMS